MNTFEKYKLTTVVGTRPEIIRLARLIPRCDEVFDHTLIHTGQNTHEMLSDVFFRELELRRPDFFFESPITPLGAFLGDALQKFEQHLLRAKPDGVLILGDTNSSLLAIIARRHRVPVYHMEAGNRSFDANVPEEINRRIVDHTADFNLVYTEAARHNLLREGLQPRFIMKVGSPLREVIDFYREKVDASNVLEEQGLASGQYFVASIHRQENVDSEERLIALLRSLEAVSSEFDFPVLVSTHPRTRSKIAALDTANLDGRIRFHEPFGFLDYIRLQMGATCVLSDSGSVSEEAAILGLSAVTLRDSMERPEALDSGVIMMSGLSPANLVHSVRVATETRNFEVPDDYQIANTSERVVRFILSTLERHREWLGIRE